jgi:hypothetical protein
VGKHVLVFILGVIVGLVVYNFVGCPECVPCKERKPDTVTVIKKIYPDTNKVNKKVIPNPIPKKKLPPYIKPLTGPKSRVCEDLNFYSDSLIDSNVTIFVEDTVRGEILGRTINYKLKVPVKEFITTTITKQVEVPTPISGLFVGVVTGWRPGQALFAPEIEYVTKRGYAFSINRYFLDKSTHVGIKKKLL